MISWLKKRTHQEKKLISIGVTSIIATSLYFGIWHPYTTNNIALEKNNIHKQKLLSWMETNVPALVKANRINTNSSKTNNGSLFAIVDKQLSIKTNGKYTFQLKQLDKSTVSVQFNDVSFDLLIQALVPLWKDYGISIDKFYVKSLTEPGIVKAQFNLKK